MSKVTVGDHIPLRATLPLVSSCCGLCYAYFEHGFFGALVRAADEDNPVVNRLTRLWWKYYLEREGFITIMAIGGSTFVGGIYTIRGLLPYSKSWYVAIAGMGFGFAHFAFAPKILPVIENMCNEDEEKQGQSIFWMKEWLRIHRWQTILTDLPAVVFFAYLAFGHAA